MTPLLIGLIIQWSLAPLRSDWSMIQQFKYETRQEINYEKNDNVIPSGISQKRRTRNYS